MENFEMVGIENVERVIMKLPKKKGTEEGITNDILKAAFYNKRTICRYNK